jgi:hypothetical protein
VALTVRALVVLVATTSTAGLSGCTKSPAVNAATAAAVTAAAAVAIRAATGSCYAQCAYGTVCDHKTGACVPARAETPAPPDADPCADECALRAADRQPGDPEPPKTTKSGCTCPPPSEVQGDPCGEMCLPGEKCVMRNGELGCE